MDDEKLLDDFLIKSQEPTPPPPGEAQAPKEDEIVEQKARQGKPLAQSILQKKTTLNEQQLNGRIAATIRKNPEIDEADLRVRLATKIEDSDDGTITEGEYVRIVNDILAKGENESQAKAPGGPLISPPPFVSSGIGALQQKTQQIADKAGSLATPGGVGFLVFALFFFVWVIVPVSNGKTRMQLLWGVLTNQVGFNPSLEASGGGADFGNSQPVQGGGADFMSTGGRVTTPQTTALFFTPSFNIDEY